jgi:hypothetical protein
MNSPSEEAPKSPHSEEEEESMASDDEKESPLPNRTWPSIEEVWDKDDVRYLHPTLQWASPFCTRTLKINLFTIF